jgi:hypothetical protein
MSRLADFEPNTIDDNVQPRLKIQKTLEKKKIDKVYIYEGIHVLYEAVMIAAVCGSNDHLKLMFVHQR